MAPVLLPTTDFSCKRISGLDIVIGGPGWGAGSSRQLRVNGGGQEERGEKNEERGEERGARKQKAVSSKQ
jgi:hypothetical protein